MVPAANVVPLSALVTNVPVVGQAPLAGTLTGAVHCACIRAVENMNSKQHMADNDFIRIGVSIKIIPEINNNVQ